MRAAVVDRYGGPEVVRVVEVPRPSIRSGDVLIRVCAVAVSSGDARVRAAHFPSGFALPARLALGVRGPRRRVLGACVSGVVEEIGDGVTTFVQGDAVCGMTGMRLGGHAEQVAVPAQRLVALPDGVSHDDAAGVLFGGTAALHFLQRGAHVAPGANVLVIGASGAVGTNAVQLARRAGARVTGVCSGANGPLALSLGAERVIDHTTTPIDALDERFDVVFDTVGALDLRSGRRLVAPGGTLLLAVASLGQTVRARGAVVAGSAPERPDDFAHLLGLVATGELRVVVDSTFDLDGIVAAHRRVDTGRKVGNVLVRP